MQNEHRMNGSAKFLFGGERFATQSATELKRGLIVDAICVLLLLLGLASAAFGQSQDPLKDEKKPPQQSSNQGASQPPPAQPQPEDSVAEAARKTKTKKTKKVYNEEDLANMKGGVSVVGDGNAQAQRSAGDLNSTDSANQGGSGGGKGEEQAWRGKAQQIHAQMDATDDQIKALKEDIKKNGASGFDAQTGRKDNAVYINDKNARLQKLEEKKNKLEEMLDQLKDESRRAGLPSDWVR